MSLVTAFCLLFLNFDKEVPPPKHLILEQPLIQKIILCEETVSLSLVEQAKIVAISLVFVLPNFFLFVSGRRANKCV